MIHPPFTLRAYSNDNLRGQPIKPAASRQGEINVDGSVLNLELARRFAQAEMALNARIDQVSVFDAEGQEITALFRNQDGTATWERITPD